jgi:flagellar biosynthetic protein FliQ
VTQINEQTLSFIPKILVIIAALVIFSPWMMETMVTYTQDLFTSIPELVRR